MPIGCCSLMEAKETSVTLIFFALVCIIIGYLIPT
ncbi:unnamed protein product [Brassica rapa subsp. narinosa]